MIYFQKENLIIRDLCAADIAPLVDEENAQGWHSTPEKLEMRLAHQSTGKCHALAAEYAGEPAGYVHVYPHSQWGPEAFHGLPEIVDFAVLEKFRRRGIGSALMDAAEALAARYAGEVYLGVGVNCSYGSAQRMYVKRGYVPDGTGAWYGDKVCEPYSETVNDDDLNLYLSKRLG